MSALDPQKVTLTLKDETVDRIARRVVELLSEEGATQGEPNGRYVGAAEVARMLNVTKQYVYDRAEEFGAVKLGSGPKARMRFDPDVVRERFAAGPSRPVRDKPRRRKPDDDDGVELLPIRGRTRRS